MSEPPTRRDQAEMMARLMTEPARSRVLEALESLGSGLSRADSLADLVREKRAPEKLAVLVALESSEWLLGGACRLGAPALWCSWFTIEVWTDARLVSAARLLADDGARRYRLCVYYASEDARRDAEMGRALEVVRRELEGHLGGGVRVCEVRR